MPFNRSTSFFLSNWSKCSSFNGSS